MSGYLYFIVFYFPLCTISFSISSIKSGGVWLLSIFTSLIILYNDSHVDGSDLLWTSEMLFFSSLSFFFFFIVSPTIISSSGKDDSHLDSMFISTFVCLFGLGVSSLVNFVILLELVWYLFPPFFMLYFSSFSWSLSFSIFLTALLLIVLVSCVGSLGSIGIDRSNS